MKSRIARTPHTPIGNHDQKTRIIAEISRGSSGLAGACNTHTMICPQLRLKQCSTPEGIVLKREQTGDGAPRSICACKVEFE